MVRYPRNITTNIVSKWFKSLMSVISYSIWVKSLPITFHRCAARFSNIFKFDNSIGRISVKFFFFFFKNFTHRNHSSGYIPFVCTYILMYSNRYQKIILYSNICFFVLLFMCIFFLIFTILHQIALCDYMGTSAF